MIQIFPRPRMVAACHLLTSSEALKTLQARQVMWQQAKDAGSVATCLWYYWAIVQLGALYPGKSLNAAQGPSAILRITWHWPRHWHNSKEPTYSTTVQGLQSWVVLPEDHFRPVTLESQWETEVILCAFVLQSIIHTQDCYEYEK